MCVSWVAGNDYYTTYVNITSVPPSDAHTMGYAFSCTCRGSGRGKDTHIRCGYGVLRNSARKLPKKKRPSTRRSRQRVGSDERCLSYPVPDYCPSVAVDQSLHEARPYASLALLGLSVQALHWPFSFSFSSGRGEVLTHFLETILPLDNAGLTVRRILYPWFTTEHAISPWPTCT